MAILKDGECLCLLKYVSVMIDNIIPLLILILMSEVLLQMYGQMDGQIE